MGATRTTLSRRGLLGAAAAAGAAALGACSRAPAGTSTGGSGDKTFTMYWNAGHGYDTYATVVKKFESDHGVTVNWQKFQWPDLLTKLQADLSAGTVPDLCEDDGSGWPVQFATTGDSLALDDFIASDGEKMGFPNDWQTASLQNGRYQGKTYGIPLHLTCNLLFYNKKMFADAGVTAPPTDWEGFLSTARKLTRGSQYGVSLNSDSSYSPIWQVQNGVTYWNPSSRQLLTPEQAAVEAMQYQHDLVHRYKVSPVPVASSDYSGPQKLFSAKRAAMIFSGPWDFGPIAKGSPDIQLGLALPLKHTKQATTLAGSGVFIPAKAKHPDLAWDLIKRLTAVDVELAATKEVGMTMPRKTWAADPSVKANPTVGTVAKALAYGVSWPNGIAATGKADQVTDDWKSAYESTVLSGGSASDAVRTFRSAAGKLVSS
jgi:multiple sugar transport system substrate-binding protein